MARRKQAEIDKSIRPEYIPLTIWEAYQEYKSDQEKYEAFGRVIFGDGIANKQRAMKEAWKAVHVAMVGKIRRVMGDSDVNFFDEDFEFSGFYGGLVMQIRHLLVMQSKDFYKMQSPGARKAAAEKKIRLLKQLVSTYEESSSLEEYEEREKLKARMVRECDEHGGRLYWALREVEQAVSINAFKRESDGKGKEYLFSAEASEQAEKRSAMLSDYAERIKETIIPVIVDDYVPSLERPLIERMREELDSLEFETYWIMCERHILPRTNVLDPQRKYMIRYLADCFFTTLCTPEEEFAPVGESDDKKQKRVFLVEVLGGKNLVSAVGRFVGAVLRVGVDRAVVKNELKGYTCYGIRVAMTENKE